MGTHRLILGDCLAVLATLPAASIDACVTDPPYGIGFMGREWDTFKPETVRRRRGARGRKGTERTSARWPGKMGTQRQGGGVSVDYDETPPGNRRFQTWCEAWAREVFRVLKPGGHLLAFGGDRTCHRLVCGIEDAGFEIRSTLLWLHAQGFPKSLDVSKALDRMAGAEPERARHRPWPVTSGTMVGASDTRPWIERSREVGYHETDGPEPVTDLARTWDGWGTALKPAFEPIVLARKPLVGTVAQNVAVHGVGGLNIDGCRIGMAGGCRVDAPWVPGEPGTVYGAGLNGQRSFNREGLGRWPANVVLSHAAGCQQVGHRRVKGNDRPNMAGHIGAGATTFLEGSRPLKKSATMHGDPDGFETVEAWDCVDDCPVAMLDAQSGERSGMAPTLLRLGATTSRSIGGQRTYGTGQPLYETVTGYGDRGGASRFFYVAKADSAERNKGLEGLDVRPVPVDRAGVGEGQDPAAPVVERNHHPTVKPVALLQWLVRLVTPPAGTVLDPFMGSGTTGIACDREGFSFIGVEREPEYMTLAEARIRGDAPLFASVAVETA